MSIIKLPPYILDSTLDFTFNNVTATGNLVATNANLGNLASANYVRGTLDSLSNAQPNITSTGTLTSLTVGGDGSIGGNLTVTGNLTISGTQTTVNSTTVNINDINIVLANNATTQAQANGAGITINGASANIVYINTSNAFSFSHPIIADGSLLSNVTGANITGIVGNANHANIADAANSVSVANVTGIGNIATINQDGNASNILYGNGVFAAAPAGGSSYTDSNVATYLPTYTGNLSPGNLIASPSNLKISGGTSGYVLSTDGTGNVSWAAQSGGGGASVIVSNTAPTGSSPGDMWFDSETGELNVFYIDTWVSITQNAPQLSSLVDSFTGNGVATDFTLSSEPVSVNYAFVSVGGILQPRTAYSITGNVLSFSSAVPNNSPVDVTVLGGSTTPISVATTVLSNAQPNITSVGTLTSLAVTGTTNLSAIGNVKITGGSSGQYLKTDGSGNLSWDSVSSSGSAATITYTPVFKGALLFAAANTAMAAATWTKISFTTVSYDTTGGALTGTASRFTIPSGVSKIKLKGEVTGSSATDQFITVFYRNGSGIGASTTVDVDSSGQDSSPAFSAVLSTNPGDYYELWAYSTIARDAVNAASTWFSIEIVEGSILNTTVSTTIGMNTLSDVDVTTNAPTNGQLLAWNSSSSEWVPSNTAISAATVTANAQPNITSLGTLTSLSVAGLISETFATKTSATGTVDHDASTVSTFLHTTPAANFTANFTNVPTTSDKIIMVVLVIAQGASVYLPTTMQIAGATQTVLWQGGSAPSGSANKYDVISYSLFRVGSSWVVFGSASSFG